MSRREEEERITGGRFVQPTADVLLPPERAYRIQAGRFVEPAASHLLPHSRKFKIGVDFDNAYHIGGSINTVMDGGEEIIARRPSRSSDIKIVVNNSIIETMELSQDTAFTLSMPLEIEWLNKSGWDVTGFVACVTVSDGISKGYRKFKTIRSHTNPYKEDNFVLNGSVAGYSTVMPGRDINLKIKIWWSGRDGDYDAGNGYPDVGLW